MNDETLCWNCNAPYSTRDAKCPACGATNANADLDAALAELAAQPEVTP